MTNMHLPRWVAVAGVAVVSVALALPARAAASPGQARDCRTVESEHFVFHDDPWINLHHFLFQWARNVPQLQPGDHRRAEEVPEAAELTALSPDEQKTWQRAVDYYRAHLIAHHLLFDRDLIALRGTLGGLACGATRIEGLDPGLRAVLTAAMPIYRSNWWARHRAANEAWIEERLGQLKTYETTLGERLAAAYGGEWASQRVRVDVAAYSNWAGAYTTNNPNQITLSSRDYMGLDGLEILFHEVSHVTFFEQPLFKELADAFREFGARPSDRLAHSIQFATPVALLRSLLGDEVPQDHQFVGDQVGERMLGREKYALVVKNWNPFLEGLISRDEALKRMAAALVAGAGEK